jgi:hypothetical protein
MKENPDCINKIKGSKITNPSLLPTTQKHSGSHSYKKENSSQANLI